MRLKVKQSSAKVGDTFTINNADFLEKTGMPTRLFEVKKIYENGDLDIKPVKELMK